MNESLLDDIILYIQFIKKEYGLYLTIHDQSGFLSNFMDKLVPYNIHNNPYCLRIKSEKELWDKCRMQQKKVFEHCGEQLFYGMCYAGVEEFVTPILYNGEKLGFISISGYATDPATAKLKIQRLSSEYNLNQSQLFSHYQDCLNPITPNREIIESTTTVLKRLFELLHINSLHIYQDQPREQFGSDYIFAHVLTYVELNYRKDIKVKDIADYCYCSNSYISHMFKQRTGMNINAYILDKRMKDAKALLSSTKIPIQEISNMLGFQDSNYFSNCFKKSCNFSPRQYRNNFKNI